MRTAKWHHKNLDKYSLNREASEVINESDEDFTLAQMNVMNHLALR